MEGWTEAVLWKNMYVFHFLSDIAILSCIVVCACVRARISRVNPDLKEQLNQALPFIPLLLYLCLLCSQFSES